MKVNELLNEYDFGNNSAMAGQDPDFDRLLLRRDARRAGMSVDDYIHYLKKKQQDQNYELEIGTEKRAELKAKAEELAEIRRQQLRKEALEDAEIAFQRAETIEQRKAEMEKIKRKYQHDLDMINTEHKNNMEAIKTGNKHELDKMDKEHRHEKDMFDKEAGERDKDRAERERERQQNKPRPQGPDGAFKMPEPEAPEEEPQDKEYQDFKADIFRLSGLPLPAPAKQELEKPSKFDKSDATDIDFKELPDKKKDDNKPAALPAPKKEDMARLRDLVAEFDQPKQRKELEVGQMVKFGIWSKPAEHRIGKIVKISEPGYEVVVDVDGKLIKLNRASKSLVIKPLDAETPDSDSKFSL